MIRSYKDLKVYQNAYSLMMELFWLTKKFPMNERFSLIDQIRRSSRSTTVNIVEGWSKRRHENIFKRHLIDSIGSCEETKLWIDVSYDCGYILADQHQCYINKSEEVSKMLNGLLQSWCTFK